MIFSTSLMGSLLSKNSTRMCLIKGMDETRLVGVQMPDGENFMGYAAGYQREFERMTKRILLRRENAG